MQSTGCGSGPTQRSQSTAVDTVQRADKGPIRSCPKTIQEAQPAWPSAPRGLRNSRRWVRADSNHSSNGVAFAAGLGAEQSSGSEWSSQREWQVDYRTCSTRNAPALNG
jgi:hypothetical protein